MSKAKRKDIQLAEECLKLVNYIAAYTNRDLRVADALGNPGVRHLHKIQALANEILEDSPQ